MKKNLETIFNVVIGTAGHIDHGKSSLVKRLTGIDPDRLPQERERGLTIDLGFAPLVLETGLRVGFIDVPGHERLVKNMVAGATGIDLVILVVAADDGVMPQTEEHVAIMDLLEIEHGIVAITKIDTVEEDMRELVREDIKESLKDTFLRDAPIQEISSVTGEGIDGLLQLLYERLSLVRPRDESGVFRMPIQRVFSSKGFGTVVTGVPVRGRIDTGATLEIVPLGQKGRVRGIQAYKEATDLARAGHSSAINLTDIDYRTVHRGMVLTEPGYFHGASMFEARLRYLASNKRPLNHQSPVRLHIGTAEGLGRVFLLEKKVVEPGEETFVQYRLTEPIAAAPGDRYVLRSYSPAFTIGGGEILDQSRWRLKTGKEYVIAQLRDRANAVGNVDRLIVNTLSSAGFEALADKELAVRVGLSTEEAKVKIAHLVESGELRRAGRAGCFLSAARQNEAKAQTLRIAREFFEKNPRRLTMDKLQLRQSLAAGDVFFQDLLHAMAGQGVLEETSGGKLRFRDFGPRLSEVDEEIRKQTLAAVKAAPFMPPAPAALAEKNGWTEQVALDIAALLEEEGELLRVGDGILFHREAIEDAKTRLRGHLDEHGSITAGDAKNLLGSTRKYSIPLLEHLDQIGFTIRQGDKRVLRKN